MTPLRQNAKKRIVKLKTHKPCIRGLIQCDLGAKIVRLRSQVSVAGSDPGSLMEVSKDIGFDSPKGPQDGK